MIIVYRIALALYYLVIRLVSPFSKKANLWISGRVNWKERLTEKMASNTRPVVWMHCSSLGEFEQGRPVIESIREKQLDCFILVSFFSPSGYEIRKNYTGADYVCYLPRDSRANANAWMQIVKPSIALFVKYEFWYSFLSGLRSRNIPVLLISANFRRDQLFFKWYGSWYRKMLEQFSILFVQHQSSAEILAEFGIRTVQVAGDTRFDRVSAIPAQVKPIPLVTEFAGDHRVIIAGSSWEPDEQLLSQFINKHGEDIKYILVPHEISDSSLKQLEAKLERKNIRFSLVKPGIDLASCQVLIIDNVGMLSSLYRYAGIAYIGGGFGKGIHNTLEAATFGMPVLFGPNYANFREAVEMVKLGCAFPVNDYESLELILEKLIGDDERRKTAGVIAGNYVKENTGATALIVERILACLNKE
ncbi:MAG: glycosyltransferase N-terminal domain-containing protein [Bacteroidales bacterium]